MKISVIIPVYNEVRYIKDVIERVERVALDKEIIVVDDGSTDGSAEVIEGLNLPNLKKVFHEKNLGKGSALHSGFRFVEGDIVIIQDADLEYDPNDYEKLIEPIVDGRADVTFGSRFLGGPHRVLYFWHYVGNHILTIFTNIMNNINLTDMETGYKAFRADLLKEIDFKSKRFGFEPEFTARMAAKRCRIYEVPISYSGREYSEGKKITWRDGISAIFHIFYYSIEARILEKKGRKG